MVDESIIYLWGSEHTRLRIDVNEADNPELHLEEDMGTGYRVSARIPLDSNRIDDIIEAIRHHTPKKESP